MAEKKADEKAEEKVEEEKNTDLPTLSKAAQEVLEKIEKMTVLELADLVKVMEDKFGVSAAAPVAVAAAPAAAEAPAEEEEKSAYDIVLTDGGANKIAVIKVIREITDLGLMEAKKLVESAPQTVRENVQKDEAEEIKAKFEEAGAKVELK